MTWWTNHQVTFFKERWAAGDSYGKIADAMAAAGMPIRSDGALKSMRERLGLTLRKPGRQRTRPLKTPRVPVWPPDRIAEARRILALRDNNKSAAARAMGISKSAMIGLFWRLNQAEKRRAL